MKKLFHFATILGFLLVLSSCYTSNSVTREARAVEQQQDQYSIGQPVPIYESSLERELVIQLYNTRNRTVSTHSVWRSDYGLVEGDCQSMGYGIPYDTSLTNPQVATDTAISGFRREGLTSIGQPEPNGVYASTNTAATWVMCVGPTGDLEPHYVEAKVTVYPGPVDVNYETGRVQRVGAATVSFVPALPSRDYSPHFDPKKLLPEENPHFLIP